MDAERKHFFLMTVEIRILTALLSRTAFRAFGDHFAAHNVEISGIHYGILRALSHQSYTISDLSRRFMLDPSTLDVSALVWARSVLVSEAALVQVKERAR